MRRTTWLITLGTCALIGGTTVAPADGDAGGPPSELSLEPSVADNLALLFSEFDRELVLCLEGKRDGSTLRITDFRMPHILLSEPGRVQATGCGSNLHIVGTWHNHPGSVSSLTSRSADALRRNCYLSRTDIADFLRRTDALVSVVACGPRTYAYWWRHDVDNLQDELTLLPPASGQLVYDRERGDEETGGLTQAR